MKISPGSPANIERFAWFESWLARGGQPPASAFRHLKSQGVRVVVNLRKRDERAEVEGAGLRYVHIPVKNDRAPRIEQIWEWLRLCNESSEAHAIFVHCKGGEGRTSTFCAAVRLAQGCAIDDAIAEQRRFDFQPEGKHAAQARFLHEFESAIKRGGTRLSPTNGSPVEP